MLELCDPEAQFSAGLCDWADLHGTLIVHWLEVHYIWQRENLWVSTNQRASAQILQSAKKEDEDSREAGQSRGEDYLSKSVCFKENWNCMKKQMKALWFWDREKVVTENAEVWNKGDEKGCWKNGALGKKTEKQIG